MRVISAASISFASSLSLNIILHQSEPDQSCQDTYNMSIRTFLTICFLNWTYTILWIEYNNLCSFNICKTCKSCFTCISDVAVKLQYRFHIIFLAEVIKRCGKIENAISLNAIVEPWNNSNVCSLHRQEVQSLLYQICYHKLY